MHVVSNSCNVALRVELHWFHHTASLHKTFNVSCLLHILRFLSCNWSYKHNYVCNVNTVTIMKLTVTHCKISLRLWPTIR